MATAAVSQHDVEVTLVLTEQEALYVMGALQHVDPAVPFADDDDTFDPVYEALGDSLRAQGISTYDAGDLAKVNA